MRRILIVDDDESVRKLLRFRLRDSYEIIDTGSAEEALSLALQYKPDAILLDLLLPQYSGFEICQTFSSLSFTQLIPIFIVSGESAARYKEFCETLGARGYFQKPVDFDALQSRLHEVLNGKKAERRSEPRVRLRAVLKLNGTDAAGKTFELETATENVSAHGFLCACTASLRVGAIVNVALFSGGRQQYCGKARVARVAWPDTPGQQCGFQFVEEPLNWVLQ